MQKEKKHPKPPRNLKASKVTHDSVTLSWDYDGENSLSVVVNDKVTESVSNGHHVLTGLNPETEYTICIADENALISNKVTITTLKYVEATDVYFAQQYVNVIPNRPTRMQVFIVPEDASDKSVDFETSVGTIKDGYITLDKVGDVADVVAKLPNGKSTSECKVVCVEKDIPVESIHGSISSTELEIGQVVPIGVGYNPPDTTQRAVDIVSSNPDIVKVENVDGNFRATGLEVGKSKLTTTSRYDKSITNYVEVEVIEKVDPPKEPEGESE